MESNKSSLSNISRTIEKALRFVLALIMIALVVVVFSNVMSRYFLQSAIAWSEELARFLLVWLVFIGAILAYIKDEHLGLDILVNALPFKVGKFVGVIANLLAIIALGFVTIGGYNIALSYMDWNSPALEIPYGYVFIIVPVCGAVMIIQAAFKLLGNIKALTQSGDIKVSTQVKAEEGIK